MTFESCASPGASAVELPSADGDSPCGDNPGGSGIEEAYDQGDVTSQVCLDPTLLLLLRPSGRSLKESARLRFSAASTRTEQRAAGVMGPFAAAALGAGRHRRGLRQPITEEIGHGAIVP
jgi:hypothetical protein